MDGPFAGAERSAPDAWPHFDLRQALSSTDTERITSDQSHDGEGLESVIAVIGMAGRFSGART